MVQAFLPNNLYQCPGVDGITHERLDHTHKSMTKSAVLSVIQDMKEEHDIIGKYWLGKFQCLTEYVNIIIFV